jgi:hypothetical protein
MPRVAVVTYGDGKLSDEHIDRDQAFVPAQVGPPDPKGLPAAGAETARKVRDKTLPGNALLEDASARSEAKPSGAAIHDWLLRTGRALSPPCPAAGESLRNCASSTCSAAPQCRGQRP